MNRFTISDLRAKIADCNTQLEPIGYKIREGGRNGYQAADLYKIGGGSGCLRNVGCGTSREVAQYCESETLGLLLRAARGEQ